MVNQEYVRMIVPGHLKDINTHNHQAAYYDDGEPCGDWIEIVFNLLNHGLTGISKQLVHACRWRKRSF